MDNIWDKRYQTDEFVYGTSPNEFIAEELIKLEPGKILFPAEGEGRNAVFAAKLGWQVFAFDFSKIAKHKADKLASDSSVQLNYQVCDYVNYEAKPEMFDCIAFSYTHLPANIRTPFFRKMIELLKPNGKIIFECFSTDQLNYFSGGPKDIDMLFTCDIIKSDFVGLSEIVVQKEIIQLSEGSLHKGLASVIRMVATK